MAGVRGTAGREQRIAPHSAATVEILLNALPTDIECVTGRSDDMEQVDHRGCRRSSSSEAVLNLVNRSTITPSIPSRQGSSRPRPAATRDTVRWSTMIPVSALRDHVGRSSPAAAQPCWCLLSTPSRTSRTGSGAPGPAPQWAVGRTAYARAAAPICPASGPRHRASGIKESSPRHSVAARPGSICCPTTSRPNSSRRQNVVRQGAANAVWSTSGSSVG